MKVQWQVTPSPHVSSLMRAMALCPSLQIVYIGCMKTKSLTQVLERVDAWPAQAQDELAEIARDIDESLGKGDYEPTPDELSGIDRGLRAANEGRFASESQVEATLAKLRGA
jgi:hypothetical protein